MLNIKTDRAVKAKAQHLARQLGLPLSIVINQYLKEFIQEGRIVFSSPLVPNVKTRKIIDQALADIRTGKNISPIFPSADAALAYLEK